MKLKTVISSSYYMVKNYQALRIERDIERSRCTRKLYILLYHFTQLTLIGSRLRES